MMHGEYGIDDVCLSILNVVGSKKAQSKVIVPLNDEELAALRHSAQCLRDVIDNIEI